MTQSEVLRATAFPIAIYDCESLAMTTKVLMLSNGGVTEDCFNNNNNGRNGSCLTWLATSLEEKRRWLIINASPRGQSVQCSK